MSDLPAPIISLVGFTSKEEIATYVEQVPQARFELAYTMSASFLQEVAPLIEGKVVSAHACCPSEPIFPNFASHDEAVLTESFEAVKRTLANTQAFGADIMVLHPGYVTDFSIPAKNGERQRLLADPSFEPYIGITEGAICRSDYIDSEVYQRHSAQATTQLVKVAALAAQYGVRLAVENLNPRVAYLFQTPQEMVTLTQASEQIYLCLDVGHLFIASAVYGFDYLEAVKEILATGRVVNCHLHTNATSKKDGRYSDDHHSIDRHGFPIDETICLLAEAGANLVLETIEEPLYNTRRIAELLEACRASG
ncbi:MAG: sugar phosphate isomerase/epimerase family protein [Sphaerochaeta sp.]|jgi:sugar phosphate isomerase/epimerase